jgi:hypothetical protein
MFVLTTLAYPLVLGALCIGSGLLVDRCSGGWLPGLLLPTVGGAALIGVSQLTTYVAPVAPGTPYAMSAVAVAGFVVGWPRVRAIVRRSWACSSQLVAPALAYALALAPVLLAGRATLSSYMGLSDSAVHMMGADFLLRHGQDYSHLDLRNSYGQYMNAYYNTSYPSGSDTLFGGSAFLLGMPLIWAFQPFNAFMLATAAGPAWLLLRRVGLDGRWAALGALTATVPALVYGYELIGSIKEVASLPMVLTLGALVVLHPSWLRRGASGAIPFALVVAAGVSALGVGFGAWVLATAVVLFAIAIGDLRAGRQGARRMLMLVGAGVIVLFLSALPTWVGASGSLQVASNIASTSNPGNLHTPLRATQVFGAWLRGSYKQLPGGVDLTVTYALIAVTVLACLAGIVHVLRSRLYPLAGWLGLMLGVWLAFSLDATTWVNAKVLMLTSPVVMLIAWAGLAGLRASPLRATGLLLAFVLAGGVLASDAFQYHNSDLAPTARYQELARVNTLFSGRGPTLFTDFDEYSLYALRDLDVGGPNFIYDPPALAGFEGGYRQPVVLDRLPPTALRSYPLIVTRRDPLADRPPSAYRLLWQGVYYEVWGRSAGAPAAIAAGGLSGPSAARCARIGRLAALARADSGHLVVAGAPDLVRVPLASSSHPARWGHLGEGLAMNRPGQLSAAFSLPRGGAWKLWLQGQIMPTVAIGLDGHPLASIGGQLGGNSLVPNTMTPIPVSLSRGRHRLSVTRGGFRLAPGDGGSAILYSLFLTPPGAPNQQPLRVLSPGRWRSLCGQALDWIEVVRA